MTILLGNSVMETTKKPNSGYKYTKKKQTSASSNKPPKEKLASAFNKHQNQEHNLSLNEHLKQQPIPISGEQVDRKQTLAPIKIRLASLFKSISKDLQ